VAVSERGRALAAPAAARRPLPGLGEWRLPLALAAVIAALSLGPYLYAHHFQPPGRVFMGFFFLGDDANTYLAKMREGWEGQLIWTNRYSSEPGPGAYFFVFWIALGKLAAVAHLSLLATFHLARVAGAFALLAAGWAFVRHFVEDERARRFAIFFMAFGLGAGYVVQAFGHPVVLGQQTDTLDWRMPELSAFYSVLALPHFAWAAAFLAAGCVLTLQAAERGSLRLAILGGLAWLGLASIHAQMELLLGPALALALALRPVGLRGFVAAALALGLALPYVGYSYYESLHSPEVLRWSAQWRNNLPPDALSLFLALAPQLLLGALAVPSMVRRRSREDLFLLAWLAFLVAILWLPTPAANLRRRFFDGVYLPLVVMAARGLHLELMPRLRSARARRLLPFGYVSFAAVGSLFLLLAPLAFTSAPQYSVTRPEYDALQWLGSQPRGVVLSTSRLGLYVPAYSSDTAYVGQYSETYDYTRKGKEATQVLSGHTPALDFARSHGVRYVLWSDELGPEPPADLGDLGDPAFSEAGVRVYRLG
jgi:hypothetical protein